MGRDTEHLEKTGRGCGVHDRGAIDRPGKREEGRQASRGRSEASTPSPKTTGDALSPVARLNLLA